ncbi:hypothetical protein BHE74_00043189, partial [Ensete ventricosum]
MEASGTHKGWQLPAGTTACSAAPTKGVDCRSPARGCRPRPFLPPAAGVATPWQHDCQRARAVTACTGAATTTY